MIGQLEERSSGDAFRPDLEGLRGVAILLVLLFHAGLPYVGGGFVGVDVFFVLSGFLITGLLVRERERTGRIVLRTFYARRARRILPAAAVVLVATLAASWIVLAPLDIPKVASDGIAVALSAGNIRFAAEATDYFAADAAPSPLLHYWSLGVEEQFYVLWPTLLILAARGSRPRVGAGVVLSAVVVVSFVASFVLTDVSAPWAFYSLPTRAWQLALGGLLAVLGSQLDRIPSRLAVAVGWTGLAAVVASMFVIDATTPYPGLAALLPSVGSAAVIVGGRSRLSVSALLRLAPLRYLGRISYSLYLVHWPILVLPAANLALGEELPVELRIALAGASVVVAAASYALIEEPIHRGRRLALPPGRTLAVAGATIAATVLIAVGVDARATQLLDEGTAVPVSAVGPGPDDGPLATEPAEAPEPTADGMTPGGAAESPDTTESAGPTGSASPQTSASPTPSGSAGASPTPRPRPTPVPRLEGPQPLPADVQPALRDAQQDSDPLLHDRCLAQEHVVQPPECIYGDPNGLRTVALVGDSHAAQWFPALQTVAQERGWKLVPFVKFSCRFVDLPQYSRILKRPYVECDRWREAVINRLATLRPDLTLVAATRGMAPMNRADSDPQRQGEAMGSLLLRMPGHVAVIVDTPQSNYDVPSCISRHVTDTSACATPRDTAFSWHHRVLERAAARVSGATLVDLSDRICSTNPCPVVVRGMIVYRDSHHLTATFSRSLAGDLAAALPDLGP